MSNFESPVQYQLQVKSISKHLFSVTLSINTEEHQQIHLRLPAWIPGSYMIRDFAKNIVNINASSDEKPLTISQLDKQSWQVSDCGDITVVRYQVYAFDLSIRAAFLDGEFGFANGTSVFLQVDEFKDTECSVFINPVTEKPDWKLYTAMQRHHVTEPGYGYYTAKSYADLIEHPLTFAKADELKFNSAGVDFCMILVGGHNADVGRIKKDLISICEHHFKLFEKGLDIKHYLFITLLTDSDYGGLEHTHSTALLFSRQDLPSVTQKDIMPDGYRTFLGLCSHELFHTWHVKRIKPKVFLKPDLGQETYSEQLWIYEGFTSYYDDLSLLRSDIISKESYLELLGQGLTRLLRTPGRFNQSITQSSFEAWSKFYKQDENAPNAIVSYYNKGAILALCLDLKIRTESRGTYTLDSVMRFLWKHYGIGLKGTPDNVIHLVLKEGLGMDLDDFLNLALYNTDELPFENLLSDFGVKTHYRTRTGKKDLGGKSASSEIPPVDLGFIYAADAGALTVKQVSNGRPAEKAGLQKGDRIIALNGWELKGKTLENELAMYPAGGKVRLDFFRRGKLCKTKFEIVEAQKDTVYLTIEDQDRATGWL
jgi:predicted metalloprotease with PDZ domain